MALGSTWEAAQRHLHAPAYTDESLDKIDDQSQDEEMVEAEELEVEDAA